MSYYTERKKHDMYDKNDNMNNNSRNTVNYNIQNKDINNMISISIL